VLLQTVNPAVFPLVSYQTIEFHGTSLAQQTYHSPHEFKVA
jgi:hypothetical protein